MAPRQRQRKIYTPIESFMIVDEAGANQYFIKDRTRVAEGSPVLKGREDQFREMDVEYDVPLDGETATATREA
jgi:hypothetical protein